MSLPIPNLDDRSFDDLMKEARTLIPVYKEWTNYNPSDPGITLLELFSWLSEMVIYRINQIPEENYRRFLKLIGIEHLFRWGEVPGVDQNRFIEFLIQNYDASWIRVANIEKIDDGRTISVSVGTNSIIFRLDDEENEVTITLDKGNTYEFPVKKELEVYNKKSDSSTFEEFLFRWGEVPENESDKNNLLESLTRISGADWIKAADVEKIDNGRAIRIFTKSNSFLLRLNDKEDKVTMVLDMSHTYEFLVKKDLRIYENIEPDIRRGLESISRHYRAITSDDYEFLALECMESLRKCLAGRAICVNNRNLEYRKGDEENPQPGHVSVIIIPSCERSVNWNENCKGYEFNWNAITGTDKIRFLEFLMQISGADWIKTANIEESKDGKIPSTPGDINTVSVSDGKNIIQLKLNDGKNKVVLTFDDYKQYELIADNSLNINGYCTNEGKPSNLLRDKVKEYLDKRKLITTRVHVVAPEYQSVTLMVRIALKENTDDKAVKDEAIKRIKQYFDPLIGGQEDKGWPLGRSLYRSEIYQLLEGIQGVDHVVKITIKTDGSEVDSVEIKKYQLITLDRAVTYPVVIEVYNE